MKSPRFIFAASALVLITQMGCGPGTTESTWYLDSDEDTYGDDANTVVAVDAPAGYVGGGGDCNDSDAAINPGVTEVYDGVDNNCDGVVDEGFTQTDYYADVDEDGYGDATDSVTDISPPAGYVEDDTDCDDTDANVNPGATEVYNSIDDNCDGAVDEGFTPTDYYRDADEDGYGDATDSVTDVSPPAGYVVDDTDCDDTNANINPGATEIYNGEDDDCDGDTDEGFTEWFLDSDSDTFGDAGSSQFSTSQPANYVADDTDCDDSNANTYPGAVELADGEDNDCDGDTDEGIMTWYADSDSDTYGDAADSVLAVSAPAGYVADGTDCDDTNGSVNPGATEVPGNGLDDDCNPATTDVLNCDYVEIEYSLTNTQYVISGTALGGAGDGSYDFDTGEMAIRYQDSGNGTPLAGGTADIVHLYQDQFFILNTTVFFWSGTTTTDVESFLLYDGRQGGSEEGTASALGTLNGAGNAITFPGGLDNFYAEGTVSCTGDATICNNVPQGPVDNTAGNISLTSIELGTGSVGGVAVDMRTNVILLQDTAQAKIEEIFGGDVSSTLTYSAPCL